MSREFPRDLNIVLTHPLNGQRYTLTRADALPATPELLSDVVAACNEPLIYDWLFRERCHGLPYTPTDAEQFMAWAGTGWREGRYFVFALTAPDGRLAGVLDIKSPALDAAEVGYWLRAEHSGLMSTALAGLEALARDAGFRALYARVRPGNERSLAVLRRAGWQQAGLDDTGLHLRFNRFLA